MGEYSYRDVLTPLMAGEHLDGAVARWAFDQIMGGRWSEAQTAAVLTSLAIKGETVEEIAAAAGSMRANVIAVDNGGLDVVDTCGTGGTGISTFNISTAAGFVAAGAGAPIAKHGNRTSTRASGSANVLAALGVNIEADASVEAQCLREAGMCFSFAVTHHPAMRFAAPVRKQLGVRTIFNLLGPLTNPAGARRQVMGVPTDDLTATIAGVLRELGASRAMIVHSADGLDEISTTAPVKVAELIDGGIILKTIDARDFGIKRTKLDRLLVETAEQSAAVVREVLAGKEGPARDIVLINAAAAIVVGGLAADLGEGLTLAATSIDTGAAAAALEKLVAVSNAGA